MKAASGKRLSQILKRRGWIRTGGSGSHEKLESPDGKVVVVIPIHGNKDLKRGLLAAVMKAAGLTEADL